MKIKLDGDYGTREHPDERVTIYCVDAPGDYPVHGRRGDCPTAWTAMGTFNTYTRGNFDLVPLQAKPLTQPSVNWDHVADKCTALTRDENGKICLHTREPIPGACAWIGGGVTSNARVFASLDPGTCDWRDSLVRRPT